MTSPCQKKNIEKICRICEENDRGCGVFLLLRRGRYAFGNEPEKLEKSVGNRVAIRAILYHFSPIYAFLTGF